MKVAEVEVIWNGHTSQVNIQKTGNTLNDFHSYHGDKTYGAGSRFNGVQFHFHHKSEHTCNGFYKDLEMHTVHYPVGAVKNGFIASAVGILFSRDHASRNDAHEVSVIDAFFESLEWSPNSASPKVVSEVTYGDLMNMVDMNNRWTYKGSVTTPPCAQNVYWNVLRTIYPLKTRHLDQFKNQLTKNSEICNRVSNGFAGGTRLPNRCSPGNNRIIQELTVDHNPFIISNGNDLSQTHVDTFIPQQEYNAQNNLLAQKAVL